MKTMHFTFLAAVAFFVSTAFADELSVLSPYRDPIRDFSSAASGSATGSGVVAVVFPRSDAAQVVFLRNGKVKVGSAEFEFPMAANYGAARVEQIKVQSEKAFTLYIRTQGNCGHGIYDYSFSQVAGVWRLATLERKEWRCSEEGIEGDWQKKYDYLNGKMTSTTFKNDYPGRLIIKPKQFPVFALAEFVPFNSAYEP